MSDVVDTANEVMQESIERALAKRAAPSNKTSAYECDECGDEIPEARRLVVVGTQHCTDCARMLERKQFINGGN